MDQLSDAYTVVYQKHFTQRDVDELLARHNNLNGIKRREVLLPKITREITETDTKSVENAMQRVVKKQKVQPDNLQ